MHSNNVAMMCADAIDSKERFRRHPFTTTYNGHSEDAFYNSDNDHPLIRIVNDYKKDVHPYMMDAVCQLVKFNKENKQNLATGIILAKGVIITPKHFVNNRKNRYFLKGYKTSPNLVRDIPLPQLNMRTKVKVLHRNKVKQWEVSSIGPLVPTGSRYNPTDTNASVDTSQSDIGWMEFEPEDNNPYYPEVEQYLVPSDIQVQDGDFLMLVGYPANVTKKTLAERYKGFGTVPSKAELQTIFKFGEKNISFGYATACNNNIITGHLDSHPGMSGGMTLLLKHGQAHYVGMYCGAPATGTISRDFGCTIMSVYHPAFCAVYATAVLPRIKNGSKWMERVLPYLKAHENLLAKFDVTVSQYEK
ncbi:hypothetical protein AKO1_002407 [Acrasis kona]|uniref:Serine protease n=1 Tax=Acrasis kona TaxID=1008807 RepID=A0AAW2YUK2_9EUKA